MESAFFTVFVYPALMVFISAFIGWFFGRKKSKAQVTGIEIENAKEIILMYKDISAQMKKDVTELRGIIEENQRIIKNYNLKCIQPKICTEL